MIGLFGARPGRSAHDFDSLIAFDNLVVRLKRGYIWCSAQEVSTWLWSLEFGTSENCKVVSLEFYICIQILSITKPPSQ